MSFSSNIKTELCKVEFKRECCLRAECYGAWLFSRCFTRKEAAFVTENGAVARRLLELAAAGAGVSGELTFGVSRRRKPAYRVSLPDEGSREAMLLEFGHTGRETSLRLNRANLENECCAAAFLRGAFLTCGTATDPNKEYHLENGLFTLLSEVEAFPLSPALASRKGGYVVYLKESGPIEDLLTYLGAPSAAMELMQVKMYKEVKNNINRKTNFETANMDKTYSASARQVAAIAAISDTQGPPGHDLAGAQRPAGPHPQRGEPPAPAAAAAGGENPGGKGRGQPAVTAHCFERRCPMALKERVQKRIDGMKVEGSWRMKLAVYGGAVLMVGGILLVMYLLLGGIGSTPQVGTVTVRSSSGEVTPLSNQIYTTTRGDRTESRRLVPGEVGDSAPTVVFDHATSILPQGGSDNGDFAFTIYDEAGRVYTETADYFQCPQEPGTYLVCEEFYWGTQRENIGMEYYFWIEVSEEYLASEGAE